MEKRTIGGFISVLRKANGLTQKQLAEKLNVSDKAVSRWERDEAMPDLSLIPVLAEIFDVTSDEILRGERRNTESTFPTEAKTEKQRKYILTERKTKYAIRSTISIGIGALGLISAMICNLGFLRAYIGFFVGLVFYLSAIICQSVFIILNLSGLDDGILTPEEANTNRLHTFKLAVRVFTSILLMIGVSLPLILIPNDPYVGLQTGSWALQGLLAGGISLIISWAAAWAVEASLTRKGVLKVNTRRKSLKRLQAQCMGVLALVLAVLFIGQLIIESYLPFAFQTGIHFSDWDSFKAYMETPVEPSEQYAIENGITIGMDVFEPTGIAPVGDPIYYDENGNILYEEPPRQIYAEDGTLLCEYYPRNSDVGSMRYTLDEDSPNIIVYTTTERQRVDRIMERIVIPLYLCLYPVSILVVFFIYRKKAKKL